MACEGSPGPGSPTLKETSIAVVEKKATEMVTTEDETKAVAVPAPYYDRNQMSFSDFFGEGADEVLGNELLKKEEERLAELDGIPFGITRLSFRHGFPSMKTKGLYLSYVSVEAVIADQAFLSARKKSLEGTSFRPGDHVVFNDGGTGIYRQMVQYLESKNYITLPQKLPAEGAKEESRYDLPPSEWTDVNVGTISFDESGFAGYQVDVRLLAPRGLRKSEYTNEFTGPDGAVTYYVA